MYKLSLNPDQIIRLSDGAIIPRGNNGDWQLYEAWISEGNKPQPSSPVVRSIDARRLKLALNQLDLLEKVESAIATLDKSAQINWHEATDISEDHPLVKALASSLGLDVDAIFNLAITLN